MTDDKLNESIPPWLNGPDLQHHQLTNTVHLALKMTCAQVVETSVINNCSFQNYTHPDDHTIRTTDTPEFKSFTSFISIVLESFCKLKLKLKQ